MCVVLYIDEQLIILEKLVGGLKRNVTTNGVNEKICLTLTSGKL